MKQPMGIEEVRQRQLHLLDALYEHCTENRLTMFLTYGTLLGAVRHQGYIPWDDDIDVMMPREDYEILSRGLTRESTIAKHARLGCMATNANWPYANAKLFDTTTVINDGHAVPGGLGVNIDIFPIDKLPSSRLAQSVHRTALTMLTRLLALQSVSRRAGRAPWKAIVRSIAQPLARRLPRPAIIRALDSIARSRNRAPARYAGVVVGSYVWSVPEGAMDSAVSLSFEGRALPAPGGWAEVLSSMYGDFMRLPPVEERVSHHTFEAFVLDG